MEQPKKEQPNAGYQIGYRHLQKFIEADPYKSREQKDAWKTFEDIRDALHKTYLEEFKKNSRVSNSDLESALREITCREHNASTEDCVKQWQGVIERYCNNLKQQSLKETLSGILKNQQ